MRSDAHKGFYPDLFKGTRQEEAARALSPKVYEFSDCLVSVLGVTDMGARFPARVTFHDGCHSLRELGIKQQPRALLYGTTYQGPIGSVITPHLCGLQEWKHLSNAPSLRGVCTSAWSGEDRSAPPSPAQPAQCRPGQTQPVGETGL